MAGNINKKITFKILTIMLKIFAKYGTSEKALIYCPRDAVNIVIQSLNFKYGGSWVLVDGIDSSRREILKFDDKLVYSGFHGKSERYSSAIESLT